MSKTFGPWPAGVLDIRDGDTLTLDVDLGFDIHIKIGCRIYGINAPELRTQAGEAARDYAYTLVAIGDEVIVVSKGWDKYGGRFDGIVTLPDGTDWATDMVQTGHAVPLVIR